MENERKLILDTETTGLSFDTDKVIEIGIVELKENVLTQNYFHQYVNPEKDISLSAQKVHGISNEFLINKPVFSKIAQKFLDFIKDDIIIMTLDMTGDEYGTLSYTINDTNYGIAFNQIDLNIKYHLVVSLDNEHKIQLLQ